jgi:guanylate kinase
MDLDKIGKNEKCILLGPIGSCVSYIFNNLKKSGLKPFTPITTLEPQPWERGVSIDEFKKLIKNGKLLFYRKTYNAHYYGVTIEDFNESQLFVLHPIDYGKIHKSIQTINKFVVLIATSRENRFKNIPGFLENEIVTTDEIKKILDYIDRDDAYYYSFNYYDLKITDPDIGHMEIYDYLD